MLPLCKEHSYVCCFAVVCCQRKGPVKYIMNKEPIFGAHFVTTFTPTPTVPHTISHNTLFPPIIRPMHAIPHAPWHTVKQHVCQAPPHISPQPHTSPMQRPGSTHSNPAPRTYSLGHHAELPSPGRAAQQAMWKTKCCPEQVPTVRSPRMWYIIGVYINII